MLEDPGPCNDRVVGWALLYVQSCKFCGSQSRDRFASPARACGLCFCHLDSDWFVVFHLASNCVALHPARLVGCWAAPLGSGRLAGFNVRFALLTEQLLVTVGTVNWLQIEAIPLLCSDGLALLNVWSSSPCLHRLPHRCHAETVLVPSSLCF